MFARLYPLPARLSQTRVSLLRHSFHSSSYVQKKVLKPFLLADIGEGITECEVLKWSVRPSAKVEAFDALCEVQSDKASVEITSPFDGVIHQLIVKEGEIAKVGEKLCLIEVEEEDGTDDAPAAISSASASNSLELSKSTTLPAAETSEALTESTITPPVDVPKEERGRHPMDPDFIPKASSSDGAVLATPSVRHFARQNKVDLAAVGPGTGREGRIEKKDVERYMAGGAATAEKTSSSGGASQAMSQPHSAEEVTVEMGRTRSAMWKSMTRSLEIPHFGYSTTLDLTELTALLPILNANIPAQYKPLPAPRHPPSVSPYSIYSSTPSTPPSDPSKHYDHLTVLPLLLKTLSRAMLEWPLFRAHISTPTPTPSDSSKAPKQSLTVRPHADISIALSTPSGLYTPTIGAVDTKSAYEIMGELRRLQVLGRSTPSGLTPADMPRRGGTITVSNVGAVGKGEWAAPLLIPGQATSIVAIGRAKWVERENGKRLEVGVSWAGDHRVIEGAELAAFVESWRAWVEQPGRLVADGR